MSDQDYPEPESADAPYPAVRLLRRHGNTIAIVFGVVPALAGLWGMAATGQLGWLAAGIAAGAAIGFLMRSYVELVRIIADMLLPR